MSDETKPGVWIVGSYDEEVKAVFQDELQARRHAMENGWSVHFRAYADKEDQ